MACGATVPGAVLVNTSEEQARATRMIKVTKVVYHDKAYPSALVVPVVP